MRLEWTEAVAAQFLAALRRDGMVRFAAEAVALSAQSAHAHKRRDAAFAVAWDATQAGMRGARMRQLWAAGERARAGRLADQRTRYDGWTPRRQKIFLRAPAKAAPALDQAAYERGVEGWDEVEFVTAANIAASAAIRTPC